MIHQENYAAVLCQSLVSSYYWDIDGVVGLFAQNTDMDQRQSYAFALGCVSDELSRAGYVHPRRCTGGAGAPSQRKCAVTKDSGRMLCFIEQQFFAA